MATLDPLTPWGIIFRAKPIVGHLESQQDSLLLYRSTLETFLKVRLMLSKSILRTAQAIESNDDNFIMWNQQRGASAGYG